MAGIPKYVHKIELKNDQHTIKMFDRFHSDIRVVKQEAMGANILLTYTTREPISQTEQTSILTFAGRPSGGNGYVLFNQ